MYKRQGKLVTVVINASQSMVLKARKNENHVHVI